MEHSTPAQPVGAPGDQPDTLLDLLIVLSRRKSFILGAALGAAVLAAVISLLIPNRYTAKAQILPPQGQSSSAALLGQLSALSGLAGGAVGVKSPNDLYVGMLNSRTVADEMIGRFGLQAVYNAKTASAARDELRNSTTITNGKDGIIGVEASATDPKLAALLANGYVDELRKMTQTLAITEAAQRRLFFEKQLVQAKQDLANAEVALKEVQEKTGLIQLSSQAAGLIGAAVRLKAEIAAKEVEIGSLRTFATTNNPEFLRKQQELSGLRGQLSKLESGSNAGNGDISVPTRNVPGASLEYVRRMRDVKYYETVFELLAKQVEVAKIDEAKDASSVQVLDKAIVPESKSKPSRAVIVIVAGVLGAFLAICATLAANVVHRRRRDPVGRARIEALGAALRWRAAK